MVHENHEMLQYTGNNILVRDTVAKKLAKINEKLINGEKLQVVFGYRHPYVQKMYFNNEKKIIKSGNPKISEEDLIEETHKYIAVPDVAGHSCGAAIDITIINKNGEKLDMGTKIYYSNFKSSNKIITYSNKITKKQLENRLKLHDLMIFENFAPFYGEWWHFSYGDREWATFYGKPNAIYKPINLELLTHI
jgi:D-alanyl-D-alanine dipeptidase